MPDDKNFLDQFSDSGKPASFQEEERVPVVRQRKPLNVKVLIIAAIALIALAIAAYFLFLAPKIVMPDFVGKTRSEVAAWVKQQGIEATGVVFDDTYDFDSDEGTILTQNVAAGKKVRNNVKLNFTLSLGPDPDERIKVPDLETMTKQEIQEWIAENKLLKTKTITAYNDYVVENNVIDYSFSGCEEDSFTRGCTLKINVSKGPAPAGKVTMEDFEKKPYASVEAWAKSKKIDLIRVDQYSDKVDAEYVISQSIASGKTIKEAKTSGSKGQDVLVQTGLSMGEDTQSNKIAKEIQEKVDNGKEVSDRDVGRLAQNIQVESNENIGKAAQTVVEERAYDKLSGAEISVEEKREAARVIARTVAGEELSKKERAILTGSDHGRHAERRGSRGIRL